MIVYNASCKTQKVKAFGNYFEFKAGQSKMMTNDIGFFLVTAKKEQGFTSLSDAFEDPEYKSSKEGKEELMKAREIGAANRIAYLEMLRYNEESSLQQDLDAKGLKIKSDLFASKGYESALEELVEYKKEGQDAAEERAKRTRELREKLSKAGA